MNLLLEIENVIEKGGSDFELSKLFKQYIQEYKASLPELFESSQGKDFLVKHTKKLDSIIALMYKTILRRSFGDFLPMRNSIPIAVVALGSYGREQLCVHSDIDLLIVYEDIEGFNSKQIIEKLFYLAMDAGLKLGHRVHEVSDLFSASNEDITIKTSLMESRFIIGSNFIWHAVQQKLSYIRLHNQKEFLLAKVKEAHARRKKHPISMQPNIKESVGGLRDAQLLYWIARTLYGIDTLKELQGVLFKEESYKEYRVALELLFRVRSALHLITGKGEDTLRLEYIPNVAKLLGFKDHMKLSTRVLAASWRINNFTRIFTKKMLRETLYDPKMLQTLRHCRLQNGIYEYNGRLYTSFIKPPRTIVELLNILLSLEDKPYKFDAAILSQFTYAKIEHPLTQEVHIALKKILQRVNSYSMLKLFYDAGILHELFANFRKVLHMPQFDGYHNYPVDLHSVECVNALENIREKNIQKLYEELPNEERLLVKIIVFFHDTGKGRMQDHSEVGAKLIVPFLKQVGFSEEYIKRAVTLVKQHVLMSSVAFKENIHNEKTLYRFMSKIGDAKNLNLLYIITYADINGVGSTTYNSFNSKLLHDLYISALEVAQNNDRITDAAKRLSIEKRVQNLPDFKEMPRTLQKKILAVESNLFFFKNTPQNIIEIAKIAKDTKEFKFTIKNEKSLTIEILRKTPINLGFLLASLSHLNVANMEIFTLFDDVKYFRIDFIQNVDGNELIDVEDIIKAAFDMQRVVTLKEIEIKREEITIDCDHSLTHAELRINTKNQNGLLAYVLHQFEELNINIVTAKIHSSKYKVRDNFLIDKQDIICNNVENIYQVLSK